MLVINGSPHAPISKSLCPLYVAPLWRKINTVPIKVIDKVNVLLEAIVKQWHDTHYNLNKIRQWLDQTCFTLYLPSTIPSQSLNSHIYALYSSLNTHDVLLINIYHKCKITHTTLQLWMMTQYDNDSHVSSPFMAQYDLWAVKAVVSVYDVGSSEWVNEGVILDAIIVKMN